MLDAIFGQTDDLSGLPAIYALESALTALWSSVGIQPSVVVGREVGEIAAAQAAGVFSLEDGLRVALEWDTDSLEATLTDVTIASPSLVLVSSVTGGVEVLDAAYWRRQAQEPVAFDKCAKKLTDLGVDIIIEIGPDAMPGSDRGRRESTSCAIESGKRRFYRSSSKGISSGTPGLISRAICGRNAPAVSRCRAIHSSTSTTGFNSQKRPQKKFDFTPADHYLFGSNHLPLRKERNNGFNYRPYQKPHRGKSGSRWAANCVAR